MGKLKKRTLFMGLICLAWILVIYAFSAMNAASSTSITDEALKVLAHIRTNNEHIDALFTYLTKNHSIFYIIRKMAHMFVFCVLQIVAFNLLRFLNISFIKSIIFSILIVFGYACVDEFHQLFVDGRSGLFSDVIIDTIGGMIGVCLVILTNTINFFIKKILFKISNTSHCKNS